MSPFLHLLSPCHSEFSSESFLFYSRPSNGSWNEFRMTFFLDRMTVRWGSCGLTTQTSASSFKNFFPSWLTYLFYGRESATKTFPINGRGEWKSLNASPIGGSGFSVRPNIRIFYPKLFYVSSFISRSFQQILKQVQDDGWVSLVADCKDLCHPTTFYLSSGVKALRLIWNLNEPCGQSATEWR